MAGPSMRSGSPPARSSRRLAPNGSAAAAARADRASAVPLAYASRHPRAPQPQARPLGDDLEVPELARETEAA